MSSLALVVDTLPNLVVVHGEAFINRTTTGTSIRP